MIATVNEAARALGCSPRAVRAKVARGELRAVARRVRVGRCCRALLVHVEPNARPSVDVATCARALGCAERTVRDLLPELARDGHAWRTTPRGRWRISRAWLFGE